MVYKINISIVVILLFQLTFCHSQDIDELTIYYQNPFIVKNHNKAPEVDPELRKFIENHLFKSVEEKIIPCKNLHLYNISEQNNVRKISTNLFDEKICDESGDCDSLTIPQSVNAIILGKIESTRSYLTVRLSLYLTNGKKICTSAEDFEVPVTELYSNNNRTIYLDPLTEKFISSLFNEVDCDMVKTNITEVKDRPNNDTLETMQTRPNGRGRNFSLQASITSSWLWPQGIDVIYNGYTVGGKIGFLHEWQFSNILSFETGLQKSFHEGGTLINSSEGVYWSKSEKGSFPDTITYGSFLYELNFVEIPFLLRWEIAKTNSWNFYIDFHALNLRINTKATGAIETFGPDVSGVDIKNEIQLFSFQSGIGLGVEYRISNAIGILLGGSYRTSFTDITKNHDARINGNGVLQSHTSKDTLNALSLSIGIRQYY